jgi:hypothetical protein
MKTFSPTEENIYKVSKAWLDDLLFFSKQAEKSQGTKNEAIAYAMLLGFCKSTESILIFNKL